MKQQLKDLREKLILRRIKLDTTIKKYYDESKIDRAEFASGIKDGIGEAVLGIEEILGIGNDGKSNGSDFMASVNKRSEWTTSLADLLLSGKNVGLVGLSLERAQAIQVSIGIRECLAEMEMLDSDNPPDTLFDCKTMEPLLAVPTSTDYDILGVVYIAPPPIEEDEDGED